MKILYIRLLTACNAGCDMCNFRFSNAPFQVTMEDYLDILNATEKSGYDWIRFTGGEPLLHHQIIDFVRLATEKGISTSIITNGVILDNKLEALAKAGLKQIIVSIDGYGVIHDSLRKHPGLFERDIENLKRAKKIGLSTRVNTVVSPLNCKSLLTLQRRLSEINVDMWELTPIKLDEQMWGSGNKELLIQTIKTLYGNTNLLVPMGRVWPSEAEEKDFFENNIMPRNGMGCNVVKDIRFLDVEHRRLFPCNMIPHRSENHSVYIEDFTRMKLNDGHIIEIADEYTKKYCAYCTGCSSSALGYEFRERGINY